MTKKVLSIGVPFALEQIAHERKVIEAFARDPQNENVASVTLEVSGVEHIIPIHDRYYPMIAALLMTIKRDEEGVIAQVNYHACTSSIERIAKRCLRLYVRFKKRSSEAFHVHMHTNRIFHREKYIFFREKWAYYSSRCQRLANFGHYLVRFGNVPEKLQDKMVEAGMFYPNDKIVFKKEDCV